MHRNQDSNKELQAKVQFLAGVPLMKRLPRDQFAVLAEVCRSQSFQPGSAVVRQGERGDAFYIIRRGEARIVITDEDGGEKNNTLLKAGDYFGEAALLRDEPRMASVIAESDLDTFAIFREDFQKLDLHDKLQFVNRKAQGGHIRRPAKAQEPTPKGPEEYRFIAKALKMNENLEPMVKLTGDRVKRLIDVMWSETVDEGQEIIKKDDLDADHFYVVQEGAFDVFAEDPANPEQLACVQTITAGGSFGELALLYLTPRAATVTCRERGLLWVVDRAQFKEVLMKRSEASLKHYMTFLDKVSIFAPLSTAEKEQLAQGVVEMHFAKGEDIITQGDLGCSFYIMFDGKVQVIKDGLDLEMLQASEDRGTMQYFGDAALFDNERRAATIRVISEKAMTLAVGRESCTETLEPLRELIQRDRTQGIGSASRRRASHARHGGRQHGLIAQTDLVMVATLDYGAFSTVELWRHASADGHAKDAATYALKCVSRAHIVKRGMQENILNEKEVLMMSNSPFIVTLYETYASRRTIAFLLEPALGGALTRAYHVKGLKGSHRHAKYYSAAMALALEHLHERRAIYRDLKPENIMLTDRGIPKLVDFGLAKYVVAKTYTTCGTPEYMAPEVINSEGHDRAVDWWGLGILIFELMAGRSPFEDSTPELIHNKVLNGIEAVPNPPKCDGAVSQLFRALLRHLPLERLPMRRAGVAGLKSHAWYEGFNWAGMADLSLPPPFTPIVKHSMDVHHFNPDEADAPEHIEFDDKNPVWLQGFATA